MKRPARMVVLTLGAALCALATSACGASSSGSGQVANAAVSDPRAAAVQKAFDSNPPTQSAPAGHVCTPHGVLIKAIVRLKNVSEAHVTQAPPNSYGQCWLVTWDGAPGVVKGVANLRTQRANVLVPLGRYVLDKVGDNQDMLGTTIAPFRAHFVASPLGASMIKAGVSHRPPDVADHEVEFHKDADGNWVAKAPYVTFKPQPFTIYGS